MLRLHAQQARSQNLKRIFTMVFIISTTCAISYTLMLHKQHGSILLKTFILQGFRTFLQPFKDITNCEFEKSPQNSRVVYPSGKPRTLHLLCCQGFAVDDLCD